MRCKGTTNSGERCQRKAQEGSDYCYQHQEGYEHNVSGRPKKYTDEFIKDLADKMINWFKSDKDNIFLEDFMIEQDLYSELCSIFAKRNDYFLQSLKRVKAIQKQRILRLGLEGEWDKTLVIFTLKNVSDMRDKKEIEMNSTTQDITSLNEQEREKRRQELREKFGDG